MPCFAKLWGVNLSICLLWLLRSCYGEDPYVFYDWRVSYATASPLGTKQQVIAVNGQFPGPTLNVTTNWNVIVNVRNDLDEPLLITWAGVQQRKNSWQDGVSGTNCAIPAGWNWTYDFQELRKNLEGHDLGAPDGKTYRLRVSNVGISTSLNFRIQNHNLILVETEGSYTVQQKYTDLDIHVGQSYSFLVTMDQDATSDYYIVASPRFVNSSSGGKAAGVALLRYSNSQGPVSGPLPDLPNNLDPSYSMTQAKSIRWNLTASAARPNPQGSFRYGQITVTDVYVLVSKPAELINGKWHATLNGLSYFTPSTPLKLAHLYNVPGVYKLDFPSKPMNRPSRLDTSLINATYRGFVEIIFQNSGTTVQTYHLDGYAFFVVGMDYGTWTENSRSIYNKDDAVARCTTQVYPGAWTAIMVSLDNSGIWNLRAEKLNSWYLGQEVYLNVVNSEKDSSEVPLPDNTIYCGLLSSLQRDQSHRIDFSHMQKLVCVSSTTLVALVITLLCFLF
uniref:Monocopper oxidase-like protein SKU5 n=1 Tax=Chenopodium quinoa TaxID=63459 RepID=A0A803MFU9_CHEQI